MRRIKDTFDMRASLSDGALSTLSRRVCMLLRAGMTLADALTAAADTKNRAVRRFLSCCADSVRDGHSLADAMSRFRRLPVSFVEAVRAGEACGRLDVSFELLSDHYERRRAVKSRVNDAVRYPIFMLILTIAVAAFTVYAIIPAISSFGGDLPPVTRALIRASELCRTFGISFAAAIVCIAAAVLLLSKTSTFSFIFALIRLRLPIIGKMLRLRAAAQFTDTLSILLSSHMTLRDAIIAAARSVENEAVRRCAAALSDKIADGIPFADAVREAGCFPVEVAELCALGDRCGTLPSAMKAAGIMCGSEARRRADKMLSMLEPALTIAVGVLVTLTSAAVYLPILSVYSSI